MPIGSVADLKKGSLDSQPLRRGFQRERREETAIECCMRQTRVELVIDDLKSTHGSHYMKELLSTITGLEWAGHAWVGVCCGKGTEMVPRYELSHACTLRETEAGLDFKLDPYTGLAFYGQRQEFSKDLPILLPLVVLLA